MSSSVLNGIWLMDDIWVFDLIVSLRLFLEARGLLILGGVFSYAFSSFKTSIVLHIGIIVIGGPILNGLNPSPKIGGHPFVVIGSIIPFSDIQDHYSHHSLVFA